jgi:multimeric flavodoxin WrbA
MKILAINGSHRREKNTAAMLNIVLEEAEAAGARTELLELVDYNIKPCISCNRCLRKSECSIKDDDIKLIADKMLDADAIILGSPAYFENVSGIMKIFMDRLRWMHMVSNLLSGRLGAAVAVAGLRNGGQELVRQNIERYLTIQGLELVESRNPYGEIVNAGAIGTLCRSFENGKVIWNRSVLEDQIAVNMCQQLGKNIVSRLSEKNVIFKEDNTSK